MQEKLIEILSSAKEWLTASEIAELGGWRSAAHVGLALKQMVGTEHRTSPTKKMGNGMPAKEYKLAEKSFTGDAPAKVEASAGGVVAELQKRCTDQELRIAVLQEELASRNRVIEALNDDIRRQVQRAEAAEANRDDIKQTLDQANRANDNWTKLAGEYECKSIPELRVFIEALVGRVEQLKKQESLIALNLEFVDGADLLEKVCTVMHERIHAAKLVAENDAAGFVIRTLGKPPRFRSKHQSATAAAMSAARRHGTAEVFALVPVGKAVRGAEWKDAA